MLTNLTNSIFGLAAALMAAGAASTIVACGSDQSGSQEDESTAGALTVEQTTARMILGTWVAAPDSKGPPTFTKISFGADGKFAADIDTGVRCVTAPCASTKHVEGNYKPDQLYYWGAWTFYVELQPASADDQDFAFNYSVYFPDGGLEIRRGSDRKWGDWDNTFVKASTGGAGAADAGSRAENK